MATKKTTAMKKKSSAKRSRSKAKKMIPAVRYLRYDVVNSSSANTETSHFIDLARDLSAINRRLMRQGRRYHVKRVTIVSKNTPVVGVVTNPETGATVNKGGRVSISTIPESWVSQGAWRRGFQTWQRMNADATMQSAGNMEGAWADFKVYMSYDMKTGTVLNPIDNGNNAVTAGEWVYTNLVTPDGTTSSDEFTLHMLGNHVGSAGARNSAGLIKSFGESRPTVNDLTPNVPNDAADDPLLNVFDYGTTVDEVIDNLLTDGDKPPYSTGEYPGDDANMPKPLVVQDTILDNGKATVGGFIAMCGLLEIESTSPVNNDTYSVLVELAPGNYRGIKADVI